MEKEILFIKLDKFTSKKNNQDYFTIEYIIQDGLNYHKDFISEDLYNKLESKELENEEVYTACFEFNNFMRASLVDIK